MRATDPARLGFNLSNSKDMRPRSRGSVRPRLASASPTFLQKRAQGKPGADCTHGSRAKKARE